jgi:hypothetical protein
MQAGKKSTKKKATKKSAAPRAAAQKGTSKKSTARKTTSKKSTSAKPVARKKAARKAPEVLAEKAEQVAQVAGKAVGRAAVEAEKVTRTATREVAGVVKKAAEAVDREIRKPAAKRPSSPAGTKAQKAARSWQPSLEEPAGSRPRYYFSTELPQQYQNSYLTAIPRDPEWVFLYWELAQNKLDEAKDRMGEGAFSTAQPVLRLLDVTEIEYNGSNAWSSADTIINGYADNWYLRVPLPDRTYIVEYGFLSSGGAFHPVLRSNPIRIPRDGISDVVDEEWATASDLNLVHLSRKGKRYRVFGSQHLMEEELEEEFAAPEKAGRINAPSSLFGGPSSFVNAPSSGR